MALSIIRTSRCLVRPFEQTPSGTLDLSVIDRLPVLRCNARTLHVFRNGPEAARVIREALSKGWFPTTLLQGVPRSPARVSFKLNAQDKVYGLLRHLLLIILNLSIILIMSQQSPMMSSFLIMFLKMTKASSHLSKCSICDGLGAAQFLNAVGELARGVEQLSISPVWCRDFSPAPPQQANATALPALPPPMPNYRLEHANIDISLDKIAQLKNEFQKSTGKTCSTFEVIAATFWRNRTIAINLKQNTNMKLVFFANCRQVLDLALPKGFYGNCFFPVTITVPTESLAQASNIEVIKLIQESKAKLPIEFGKYLKGEYLNDGEDPFTPPLIYSTLFISEWGRLGFNQVDYGWGPPVHIVPIQGSSIIPVGIIGSLPLPKKGIRLMTWCVEEGHRQQFINQIMKAT
ncbi:hypothetical protein GH714_038036 [Hevea brasiliensis]|uniref:Uncharacterized protein n=1 Tax=Hevea brasiliensis TaxID=3981 RepID=A0A6A6LXB7_HEVBR|nr:hypothetical protein GH714_038036 [Hevea brasiliensis]